jgi:Ser/Thr protein kinase RdoA (MazF antagonist)
METRIRERFHDAILQEAMHRYGIDAHQIQPLDAFESFIYEFERQDLAYILRINHSLRRSEALIEGEVEWINYLAAGGVSVAPAINSQSGKLVEAIEDGQGGQFLTTAFVKAQGRSPRRLWTPTLYAEFGRLLGRMHALAEHYRPSRPEIRRPAWDDESMDFPALYLPDSEAVAKQKYQALCEYARRLPTNPQTYGLVHFDAHGGNCLVDDAGRLTMFDFDDCTYTWYANDIAIAISNIAWGSPDAPAIASHFIRGYRQAYPLDRKWLREIPVFLKMVEIFTYAVFFRDNDATHLTDPDSQRYLRDLKYNIEHAVPTFSFDFETL